jgi:NAD-reducing hydrogenase large subunit
VQTFGNFPTLFLALVGPDDGWEHYAGRLRMVDAHGTVVADALDPDRYQDFIGEAVVGRLLPQVALLPPAGVPRGRLPGGAAGAAQRLRGRGHPWADQELRECRDRAHGVATSSFYYHYARLIEIATALERIEQLVQDDDLSSTRIRAPARASRPGTSSSGATPAAALPPETGRRPDRSP